MLSNKFFKKVLIGALTVSMLAGTGITASAAVASPAPTFPSASPSNMVVPKEDLVNYINEKFPKEEAKELINKIYTSAFEALPEDTKQQVQQIIAVVSQEGFPEFMAQKFISDLVDTLYKEYLAAKDTAIATGKNIAETIKAAYAKLPEELRTKIAQAAQQVQMLSMAIQEKAAKYTIAESQLFYTDGDFTYQIDLDLNNGVYAKAVKYLGTEKKIAVPSVADMFQVISVKLTSENTVTAVTLPETIKEVDGYSFFKMPTLKYIYINKANPYFKSVNGIVLNKEGTTVVAVAATRKYSPSERITAIGNYAFYGNNSETVTIPDSVTSIGEGAFMFSKLSEVTIPAGVTEIKSLTFSNCKELEKIVVLPTVTKIADDAFTDVPKDAVFYCENNTDYAVGYAEKQGFKVNAPFDAEFKTTSITLLGASSTFSAQGKYGAGDYKYAFYYRTKGSKKWTTKQKYASNNTIELKPANTGDYEICIKVKDADGKVIKKYFDWKVAQSFNNQSKIFKKGNAVVVNCKAIDMESVFAVYYMNVNDSKWTTVQKYDKNNIASIVFDKPGDYQICVKAKSKIGFISKSFFNVTVTDEDIAKSAAEKTITE